MSSQRRTSHLLLLVLPLLHPAIAAAEPAPLLDVVTRYADTLIERGRDTYGSQRSGLLLSALDRATLSPLAVRPAPPDGIRREDRPGPPWSALTGANPQLDQNVLRVFYALSQVTGDPSYGKVADEELTWFLTNTASPKTGLLPWGEHLFWDVMEDKPASGGTEPVHEFARPWVLWDRCFALAPQESRQFALGLWEHQIADHQSGAFDRHASYFEHGPRDGKDFPRHAGFYIATWGYAYKHTKDPVFLRAIETLLARFERKGKKPDGTRVATIGPLDCDTAAGLVPAGLAARLRDFARAEDELILADLQKSLSGRDAAQASQPPLWRTGYGVGTLASTAMLCLARHEQAGNPAYRDALVAIADCYRDSLPEEDLDAWPVSFAHAISTNVAAHRFTNRYAYLEQADRLARTAVERFWQDNPLPRASLKTGHYETITGADTLALALLEVYAATHNSSVTLPSNTIDR